MVSLNTIESVGRGIPAPLVTDCCTAFIGAAVGVGAGADDINLDVLVAVVVVVTVELLGGGRGGA